jgi:phosphotransferase system HPr (HPr) family protein
MPSNKLASRQAAGSLHEILAENEFRGMLDQEMRGLFECYAVLDQTPRREWVKRHFHWIHQEADHLETFLDDHGARSNRVFRRFRELVAGIRGFAEKCHVLGHLDQRISQYRMVLPSDVVATFVKELHQTQSFTIEALGKLYKELAIEARLVGCGNPPTVVDPRQLDSAPETVRRKLPNNVDEEAAVGSEGQHIVELSTAYMEIEKQLCRLDAGPQATATELEAFVRSSFTEAVARSFEARIHNLQAKYDTHVRNTPEERRLTDLSVLRGHVSAALHLTEYATRLVHFYERHESDLRSSNQRLAIAAIVDKNLVLDRAVHFALRWAREFVVLGRPFAERLLGEFTQQKRVDLAIPEGVMLHARPASLIVSVVNHHGVPVEIEIEGESVNAGSIMQVMILAGNKATARRVTFRGDVKPLRDLELLFAAGLGEAGSAGLPVELSYLNV